MGSFWDWLTQSPQPQQIGLPAVTGSGEVDVEGTGGPGGSPGDFGGETNTPIDPYTGQPVPRDSGQPALFGVSVGTIIWVVAAIVVANAAMNVGGGSGSSRRRRR